MAVVTLQTPINVSNPESRRRMIRDAVNKLEERRLLLKCAADSASASNAEEELTLALYWLHDEIKSALDTINTLTLNALS